jgi:hypothetical protein
MSVRTEGQDQGHIREVILVLESEKKYQGHQRDVGEG